jgi:hypothetical protein
VLASSFVFPADGARADDATLETPMELAVELADLGPRAPATLAHDQARELLVDRLRSLGVGEIRSDPDPRGTRNIEGVVPGAQPSLGEIVLAAHYDTVAESPGAADDAGGCAVVIGVIAELQRAPLRRTLRVVFFDGEEVGLLGSDAWVDRLTQADRDRILASLHLDVIGVDRDGAPVVLDMGGATGSKGPARAPAWLIHAALKAGAAVGFPFRVGDHVAPMRAQVLTRTARVPWTSDAAPLLEAGIPSIVLTDFSALHPYDAMHTPEDVPTRLRAERLAQWVQATTATVRRIDALAGRPLWEEEYLAFAGRVWIRRDLLWIGFGLWILLVLRGRPGRWAGAETPERRARGRTYLPGYLFRLAFLLSTFLIPALAAPLLYPLAPLGMVTPRSTASRVAIAGLACLPAAGWLGLLALAGWLGLASGFALEPFKVLLLVATLVTFTWQLWSRPVGTRPVGLPR